MAGKIGVAISTHNRTAVLAAALSRWSRFMPDVLVVNHDRDGSGVAPTKNLGLAALMDSGCDHLVLADDDVGPLREWASHYVEDDSVHLMACWGKSRYVGTVRGHTVWKWPRGCLLYLTREVVERVGGMRLDFGPLGGEHVELSRRIHAAGFTEFPFMDAASARSGVWFYDSSAPTTLGRQRYDDPALARRRAELLEHYRGSDEFVPYR